MPADPSLREKTPGDAPAGQGRDEGRHSLEDLRVPRGNRLEALKG
jgi:hypothetical protein